MTSEVGELFNSKAAGWQRKYRAGGPLEERLAAFEARLSTRLSPPKDVLDFGCGTGDLAARLASLGHRVTGCDIAERMLEEAKHAHAAAPIRWVQLGADASRWPFDDASFDAIVASSVFEYVPSLAATLAECRRVLRPGGLLVFTVPNPQARVRRLEALARPLAIASRRVPMPRLLARLDRYAQYLRLSRNRFPVDGWRRVLGEAGFDAARDGVRADGAFGARDAALMLLAFERRAD